MDLNSILNQEVDEHAQKEEGDEHAQKEEGDEHAQKEEGEEHAQKEEGDEHAGQKTEDEEDPFSLINRNDYEYSDEDHQSDSEPPEDRYMNAPYGPSERVTVGTISSHKFGNGKPYTSLATDRFHRWLCPSCIIYKPAPGAAQEETRRWNNAQQIGYTIVESNLDRTVVKSESPIPYKAVNEGRTVGYFANPPTALQCLHNWKALDGTGVTENCPVDRSTYRPLISRSVASQHTPATWWQDHCNPNNATGCESLQSRMLALEIRRSRKLIQNNHRSNADFKEYEQYADPMDYENFRYRGTWPCPKCSVDKEQCKLVLEWDRYANKLRAAHFSARQFAPVRLEAVGCYTDRICFINAFSDTKKPGRGYICTNTKFGDGPSGDKDIVCGYQYGTEFRFVVKTEPPYFSVYSPA